MYMSIINEDISLIFQKLDLKRWIADKILALEILNHKHPFYSSVFFSLLLDLIELLALNVLFFLTHPSSKTQNTTIIDLFQ